MRIEQDIKLNYNDVLLRPKRSALGSRKEVELERKFTFKHSGTEFYGVPIMAANMRGVGNLPMASALIKHKIFTCFDKSYDQYQIADFVDEHESYGRFVSFTTGITNKDTGHIDAILAKYRSIKYVSIDVANGYSENFINFVNTFRNNYPDITIIAGNVVTPEITEELLLRGADIVKVGIGPGSVCTTRTKTGVGYPQLSAVIECADAAHGLGGHIIADGGCTCPGDVVKAFGAGADFVMLGGMLAGCTESGMQIVDGHVMFYGNSSSEAQKNGVELHRTSEGRVTRIPHRGSVNYVVQDILGGLRSGCTYVGAKSLKDLSKCTTFIRVNNSVTYNSSLQNFQVGE